MSSDAKIIVAIITVGIALGGFAMSSMNMRLDRIEADIREFRSLHLMATQNANKPSSSQPAEQPAATAQD